MSSSTVSNKYQVVISKELRKGLRLRPGQKVYLTRKNDSNINISTESRVQKLFGSMSGAWGEDSDAFLAAGRQEALHDRT